MPQTVFVTGAAGFVGQALCRALKQHDAAMIVRGLCRTTRQADRLRAFGVEPVIGDLTDASTFAAALADATIVFHFGADATFGEGAHYQAVNVDATRAIVDRLVTANDAQPGRLTRFVFASSIGAVDRASSDRCGSPLTSATAPHPSSSYGRSKLDAERVVATSPLPFTILRFPWVYGPGMRLGSHIAVMQRDGSQGKLYTRVPFPGRVSVLYIDDLTDILVRLLDSPAETRTTHFVDDGRPQTFATIFADGRARGRRGGGMPIPRALLQLPLTFRSQLPFTLRVALEDALVCTSTLPAILGKISFTPFSTGLARTWDYVERETRGIHVVTGAASGIGRSLATLLARQGKPMLLIDASPAVAEVGAELGQPSLQLDLSLPASLEAIERHIVDHGVFVEGLINCAGIGVRATFAEHTDEQIRRTIAVNFTSAALLCRQVLPEMTRRRSGYIINIASSIAHVPVPYMSLYGASKAALASLGQSLAAELAGTPVQVLTAFPSGTRTDFQRAAGVEVLRDGRGLLDPDVVAAAILAARDAGRRQVWIGTSGRVLDLLTGLLPAAIQRQLWRIAMKAAR